MPQQKRDAVHRYFTFEASSNYSQCKLCGNKLKGKHTSNLKNHLAGKHVNTYKEVSNLNKARRPQKDNTNKPDNVRALCVQLVAVYGRPLDMIDDEPFQKLLRLAAPSISKVINKGTIEKMIPEVSYKLKLKITSEINQKLIILKLDTVICVERKFLGINVQYVKDNKIVVRNLAVLEIHRSPTEEYLTERVLEVLQDFAIPIEQVYAITTDNGSNLKRPAILMGGNYYAEDFMDTKEDNDQWDIFDDDDIDDSEDEEQDIELIAERSQYFEFSHNAILHNLTPDIKTGFRIRGMLCAAHTLQITIKDAINENGKVQHILEMARRVVKILRNTFNKNVIKQANLRAPIIDCPSRWTSTFTMLVRLASLRTLCENIDEVTEIISSTFWSEIDALINCLETLYKCSLVVQKKQLTVGDFFITWLKCKTHIECIKHHLAESIHKAMEIKEKGLLESDIILEALYLDGRLNVVLTDEQSQRAQCLLKQTWLQIQMLNQSSSSATNLKIPSPTQPGTSNIQSHQIERIDICVEPSTDDSENCRKNDLSRIQDMLDRKEMSRKMSTREASSFEEGLLEFRSSPRLALDTDIIRHWNVNTAANSDIAMVANTVMATPVTQLSVKRLLSSLKFILSPLRNDLPRSLLQNILLLRSNKDLLE